MGVMPNLMLNLFEDRLCISICPVGETPTRRNERMGINALRMTGLGNSK